MDLIVTSDSQNASEIVANLFKKQIEKKPNSVLGLATGSTPLGVYKNLINYNLDFSKVITFNLDEYVGLDKTHSQSYYYYMYNNLFNYVNCNNVNLPDGNSKDLEKECRLYDEMIKNSGGIDLQLLGIGHNGHIGFNEPNDCFKMNTNVVNLTDGTIKANSRFFNNINEVPKQAITMGMSSIMNSKKIVLLATGKDKAPVITHLINGKIVTPEIPATILKVHHDVTIILDKEAASLL